MKKFLNFFKKNEQEYSLQLQIIDESLAILFHKNIPVGTCAVGVCKDLMFMMTENLLYFEGKYVYLCREKNQKFKREMLGEAEWEKIFKEFLKFELPSKKTAVSRILALLKENKHSKEDYFVQLLAVLKKIPEKPKKNFFRIDNFLELLMPLFLPFFNDILKETNDFACTKLWELFFEKKENVFLTLNSFLWRETDQYLKKNLAAEDGIADRFVYTFQAENLSSPHLPLLLLSEISERVPSYQPKFKAVIQKLFLQKTYFNFSSPTSFFAAAVDAEIFLKNLGIRVTPAELPFSDKESGKKTAGAYQVRLYEGEFPIFEEKEEEFLTIFVGNNAFLSSSKYIQERETAAKVCSSVSVLNLNGGSKTLIYDADGVRDGQTGLGHDALAVVFFGKKASDTDKEFIIKEHIGSLSEKVKLLSEKYIFADNFQVLTPEKPDFLLVYENQSTKKMFENLVDLKEIFKSITVLNDKKGTAGVEKPFEYDLILPAEKLKKYSFYTVPHTLGSDFKHAFVADFLLSNRFFQDSYPIWAVEEMIETENELPGFFSGVSQVKMLNLRHEAKQIFDAFFDKKLDMGVIFDYILAILSAPIYGKFFSDILVHTSARIPIKCTKNEFWRISEAGMRLKKLLLLQEIPQDEAIKFKNIKNTNIKFFKYEDDKIFLSEKFYIEGISPEMLAFKIGHRQVLRHFFSGKKALSVNDSARFEQICKCVKAIISAEAELDDWVKPLLMRTK